VKGKSIAETSQMMNCTVADINRALDKAAQAAMTPAARVRAIYLDAARLEHIQQVFLPLAGVPTTRRRWSLSGRRSGRRR
jgi:hypothetical protein